MALPDQGKKINDARNFTKQVIQDNVIRQASWLKLDISKAQHGALKEGTSTIRLKHGY